MKKARLSVMMLGALLTAGSAGAVETAPYNTCDFNKAIDTSNHEFKVASNWSHIAESYEVEDYYGWGSDTYWVSYSYKTSGGADNSAYLYVGNQKIGDSYDTKAVKDVLVTPLVKGDVKIKVWREYSYYDSSIDIYAINENGTLGALLKSITKSDLTDLQNGTWTEITLAEGLTDYQRLGLRVQYLGIDDFWATSADITPEKGLKITQFIADEQHEAQYPYKWDEDLDHKVNLSYRVKVQNTGDVALNAGDENYTVTILNGNVSSNGDLFTVPIPVALGVNEESEEFVVAGAIEDIAKVWSYSTAQVKLNCRENITGTVKVADKYSQYNPYEPKFMFRNEGSTSYSSLSDPVSLGIIQEDAIRRFDISNDGNAPLTIKSISVPEGFTMTFDEAGEFIMEPGTIKTLTVSLPASVPGNYSGNITVVYLDKTGTSEQTYTLAISGTVVTADTWQTGFGDKTTDPSLAWPEGSVAMTGIRADYTGNNYYIAGSSNNNMFVTPKLHVEAGQTMSFETAADSYNTSSYPYEVKVYLSETRDLAEGAAPALTVGVDEINGTTFVSKSFTASATGDYYVVFELKNARLDNVAGFKKTDVDRDIYVQGFSGISSPVTKKSGESLSFSFNCISPVSMTADQYTVEFKANGETVCSPASVDLTANAKTLTAFKVEWTPEVENTTVFNTEIVFSFPGSETPAITAAGPVATITNQADFVFNNKGIQDNNWYKPDSKHTPVSFGTTNTVGDTQEYEIFNWGTKALQVKSISIEGEGFSVSQAGPAEVASKDHFYVDVTFSAETPGTYEATLNIVYAGLEGDETFTLPVNGILLDTTKWYAPIKVTEGSLDVIWPDGSVRASSDLSATNTGTYTEPNFALYSYNAAMFISPKLHAEAGEILSLNAKLYGTSEQYQTGYVNIYTAPTREGLSNEAERNLVTRISGKDVEENRLVTSDWQLMSIEMPEGDYFVGFEFGERLYVNYFYGLSPLSNGADLVLASSDIPAAAMQNTLKSMYLSVRNFGMKAAEPEDYSVSVFVDGEKVSENAGAVAIPVHHAAFETALAIPVGLRYPKVGTFPVYMQLTSGDQVLTTEPVDVTFSEEVFSSEKQVGEVYAAQPLSSDVPMKFYDKNSEAVMLFNADDLQLNEGDKISEIRFRGYCNSSRGDFSTNLQVYYQWTSDQTQEQPANGMFDPVEAGMTAVINDVDSRTWNAVQGSKEELVDMIVLHFNEPIVYENGKSLRIYAAHWDASNYMSSSTYGYERTELTRNAYYHSNDTKATVQSTLYWSSAPLPVIYLSLAVEPVTLTGTVTDNGEAVEGAAVTLVSTDGDNVQYTGTTAADGTYSINVIQNSRAYDVTAATDSKEDFLLDQLFTENASRDFSLLDVVEIDNTVGAHAANGQAVVKLNLDLEAGYNTVVLPFSLTSDEARALFGDDCEVLYFGKSELAGNGDLRMWFGHEDENKGIVAGKPYVVNMFDAPAATRYRGKAVITETAPVADSNVSFNGTYEAKALEDGIFLLNSGNFVPAAANARAASGIAPYSAYVKALNPAVKNVTFTVDDNVASAIEEIDADLFNENDVIYNLQGVRVSNPEKGIYIVNGRKVMVK